MTTYTRIEITDKIYNQNEDGSLSWKYGGEGVLFYCYVQDEKNYKTVFYQPFYSYRTGDHTFFIMVNRSLHDTISSIDPNYKIEVDDPKSHFSRVYILVDPKLAVLVKLAI